MAKLILSQNAPGSQFLSPNAIGKQDWYKECHRLIIGKSFSGKVLSYARGIAKFLLNLGNRRVEIGIKLSSADKVTLTEGDNTGILPKAWATFAKLMNEDVQEWKVQFIRDNTRRALPCLIYARLSHKGNMVWVEVGDIKRLSTISKDDASWLTAVATRDNPQEKTTFIPPGGRKSKVAATAVSVDEFFNTIMLTNTHNKPE